MGGWGSNEGGAGVGSGVWFWRRLYKPFLNNFLNLENIAYAC